MHCRCFLVGREPKQENQQSSPSEKVIEGTLEHKESWGHKRVILVAKRLEVSSKLLLHSSEIVEEEVVLNEV